MGTNTLKCIFCHKIFKTKHGIANHYDKTHNESQYNQEWQRAHDLKKSRSKTPTKILQGQPASPRAQRALKRSWSKAHEDGQSESVDAEHGLAKTDVRSIKTEVSVSEVYPAFLCLQMLFLHLSCIEMNSCEDMEFQQDPARWVLSTIVRMPCSIQDTIKVMRDKLERLGEDIDVILALSGMSRAEHVSFREKEEGIAFCQEWFTHVVDFFRELLDPQVSTVENSSTQSVVKEVFASEEIDARAEKNEQFILWYYYEH